MDYHIGLALAMENSADECGDWGLGLREFL